MAMLDRFYLIVDSFDWIERLIPAGVRLVQLRIKERPEVDVRRQVREAKVFCAAHGAQLIVNDYWEIALDEGCDFIHLGQGDLDTADLKKLRSAGIRVGISTHDRAELERALVAGPDYVALGPIYPTRLKQMPWAPQGLGRITEWKRLIGNLPLVAIGGITAERAPRCLAAGADCTAVVSDIIANKDPVARTLAWIAATKAAP